MSYPNLTPMDIKMITEFFTFADFNNNKMITFNELINVTSFDINGDGIISDSEKEYCISPWIEAYFGNKMYPIDQTFTLAELLQLSNDIKATGS